MRKITMPSAYTILLSIIVIVAILTWIVPAGQYEYVDPTASKLQPIPGTYTRAEQNPQGFWEIINAPIKGFQDATDIALFILVIGGFLAVFFLGVSPAISPATSTLKRSKVLLASREILYLSI